MRFENQVNQLNQVCLPSIAIAGGKAHEAVGEFILTDEGAQLAAEVGRIAHGPIPIAHNSLRDKGGEIVVRFPADTFDRDGDVGRRDGVVPYPDLGSHEIRSLLLSSCARRGRVGWGFSGQGAKMLLGQANHFVVRDTSGAYQDHAVGEIVLLDVAGQVVTLNARNILLWAQDGAAEGLALEGSGVQMVKDDFLHLLVDFLLLSEDHVTLPFDG